MKTITTKSGVQYCLMSNGTVWRNIPGTGQWEVQISLIPEVRELLEINPETPKLVFSPSGALDRVWQ